MSHYLEKEKGKEEKEEKKRKRMKPMSRCPKANQR
jgi:hypothetical protein